ncbi:hypothetical protein DRQ09_05650 [candidate division KSB1 bacterium]|nr:MAG: hypothetical protein DRQ09_05650 [candidate division KSB1 bacterium]
MYKSEWNYLPYIKLSVYNTLGQLVRTLINEEKSPGEYRVIWDGKDNNGGYVSSGIYLYRVDTGEFSKIRKMMLIK